MPGRRGGARRAPPSSPAPPQPPCVVLRQNQKTQRHGSCSASRAGSGALGTGQAAAAGRRRCAHRAGRSGRRDVLRHGHGTPPTRALPASPRPRCGRAPSRRAPTWLRLSLVRINVDRGDSQDARALGNVNLGWVRDTYACARRARIDVRARTGRCFDGSERRRPAWNYTYVYYLLIRRSHAAGGAGFVRYVLLQRA